MCRLANLSLAVIFAVVLIPSLLFGKNGEPPVMTNFCTGNKTHNCATVPTPINRVEPQYSPPPPSPTKRRGRKGYATLAVGVGADGHVYSVKVLHPVGYGLDELAVEAVKKWEFMPSTYNGTPVAASITIRIGFVLYK